MAFHKILLQGVEFIGRYVFTAQRTETGSDTIQRLGGSRNFPVEIITAFPDALFGFGSQFQFQVFVNDAFDDTESQLPEPT